VAKTIYVNVAGPPSARGQEVKEEFVEKIADPDAFLKTLYEYTARKFDTVEQKLEAILAAENPLSHEEFNSVMRYCIFTFQIIYKSK